MEAKYKRIILKISGEALSSSKENIDFEIVNTVARQVAEISDMGVEVCIIVGGGNIWRGRQGKNMDRVTADHMGMLATVINSLAIQDALEAMGKQVRLQTAIEMIKVAEPFIRRKAVRHLEKGRIVIFACGTGNPYFTTDTATALRAAEAVRSLPPEKRPAKVYALEVWRGLDWLCDEDKVCFDTSEHPNLAAALLGVYDSQIAGGKRYDSAAIGRRLANATFYASHNTDRFESCSYGIDITDFVNGEETPEAFISAYIRKFENEVGSRLRRLS